ncbi:MAG: glycosyltransferase family 1 protein [bacterium]
MTRIAVNLLPFREKLGGAGQYAKNVIEELAKLDKENDYYLFVTKNSIHHFNVTQKNFHCIQCNFNSENILTRIFWEQFGLTREIKKYNCDVLFTPSVAIPLFYSGKMITTIHDIAYVRNKNKYGYFRRKYVAYITKKAYQKSTIVLTVSYFSKKEMTEFLGSRENVVVVHNRINRRFLQEFNSEEIEKIRNRYALPDKFILYVGAIEPGKNLDSLIIAFNRIIKDYPDLFIAITGGIGWKQKYLFKIVDDLKIRNHIKILPYIPDVDLPFIYGAAKILTYISPYEGFGLPVLEALACRLPVVSSKAPAILEFAEDSILSVDSGDISQIEIAIRKLLTDRKLSEDLINKGYAVAQKFTWNRTAEILLNEIKRI